jgi:predicted ArsR family transcriptional regulator
MTGLQDPYEKPLNPELIITTESEPVEESVKKIVAALKEHGYLATMKKNFENQVLIEYQKLIIKS